MAEARRGVNPPVISKELGTKLEQHKGKWVAIDAGLLVAAADSLPEALRIARERGVPDPLTLQVPQHPELPFFGRVIG